jgi:hypothetical protein
MSWTQCFKKQNCTAAKDVNLANLASTPKIKVPMMVIQSFQRKVAAIKTPFEVIVELDTTADKGRIVVKNHVTGDATIEWAKAMENQQKAIASLQNGANSGRLILVKHELASFRPISDKFLRELEDVKQRVKNLKEGVKILEADSGDSGLKEDIASTRKELLEAAADGKEIFDRHEEWYLGSGRKGIAPILQKFKVDEKAISPKDAQELGKALHELSAAAGNVKKVWDVDVHAAVDALVVRLSNLESTATKERSAALADVRKNLAVEVQKIRILVDKVETELKLPSMLDLIKKMQDPNSDRAQTYKETPSALESQLGSNRVRLENIPKFVEHVTKQVSRLKKGIPLTFASDPELKTMAGELDKLVMQNNKNMAEGKLIIERCDVALRNFAKLAKLI